MISVSSNRRTARSSANWSATIASKGKPPIGNWRNATARLYVNFFQPSMKPAKKRQAGSTVHRTYDPAKTPFRVLVASGVLSESTETGLVALAHALDPVQQLQQLQDALWRHAVFRTPAPEPLGGSNPQQLRRFDTESQQAAEATGPATNQHRKYQRTQKSLGPRWWRTRADPCADLWEEIVVWLEAEPTRTGTSVFAELQQRYPGRFTDGQCRTLHRRVGEWRAQHLLAFDDVWLEEETLVTGRRPRPLRVVPVDQAKESTLADGRRG